MASIEGKDLNARHVFTRNIAAASSLVAIGARLRTTMPVTATNQPGKADDVCFWFENEQIAVAGEVKSSAEWLTLLLCPWNAFNLSLDHPVAFLKATSENRQILVGAVKTARDHPFRVMQRGNRIAVLGPGVSEENARKLLSLG